jgi:hypothetical protein
MKSSASPMSLWTYRAVLGTQGSAFGCAGLMLLGIALIALAGGALLTSVALWAVALAFLLAAGGIGFLAFRISSNERPWRIAFGILEVALAVVGVPLLSYGNSAPVQTQGPFADGGYALATLIGSLFVCGGVIALAMLGLERLTSLKGGGPNLPVEQRP